jgi:hypothetical protein
MFANAALGYSRPPGASGFFAISLTINNPRDWPASESLV